MLEQTAFMGRHLFLTVLVLMVVLLASAAIPLAVLIRLPPDYFAASRAQGFQKSGHPIYYWAGIVFRNLLGATLVVLGVVLTVPGIPGQGPLTVLAGVLLLDFPGKRELLFKLFSRPHLLRSINRLRARFSRPPLVG